MQGQLIVVSAPSGAGKTSLVKAVVQRMPEVHLSISYTTRPQRPAEQDGVDYFFVDATEFQAMQSRDEFVESAQVFDHAYGTSAPQIQQMLDDGRDVILEIDWQGAQQVRQRFTEAVSIFILPPSREALLERLKNRGQDDEKVVQARMAGAHEELSHYAEFDYIVLNDAFDKALDDCCAIIQAGHLQREEQLQRHSELLESLLEQHERT